ncbi:lysin A [Mycobacterium phage Refuge]|uniref:Lysin A n=1 Tax=Mycobacterium phage Refuge TaxID=2517967 RepID=A0A482JE75_9CAUD|nr:endolysin [Mycobacterium phage Refuge]QBP31034.1 lysin A [Mycobacterium phage Refuge]
MARLDSENGWRPPWVGQDMLQWADIPGAPGVSMQFMKGWPLVVMRAFAADFHAYVQPLRDADCACYTPTNSVSTSNHLNGTAMDLRWNSHPFHVPGTFSPSEMATLRELLDFYEKIIFWGGDWESPIDEMHFQMGYGTWNNPRVGDFILRKIRPDGFSTFRRGVTPTPAATDPAWVLAKATGLGIDRAREILPAVRSGLLASGCTTTPRIAMWLAQVGHESVSFKYTEEIAKNGRYAPYIGRTWIQITWDYNYRAFGKWCFEHGLVPDSEYFVRDYVALADLKWAGLGAAWYWTEARGTAINDAADRRDLNAATKLINGGYNGLSDRQTRLNLANTLGDLLLNLITEEDDTLADPAIIKKINEIHACLFNETESWSALATPGEGAIYQLHEKIHSLDGMVHPLYAERRARAGDLGELHRIVLAAKGMGRNTDQVTVRVFQQILAEIEKDHPEYLKAYLAQMGAK